MNSMQPVITQAYHRDCRMLWFDATGDPLVHRVKKATVFFENKYDVCANIAEVPPAENPAPDLEVDGVRVIVNSKLMPNHMYIGRVE